ncbi:MFS transporter [Amnibacterium flavum]|uniref:Major facilitator superfamily (MFS) profile domain-containing protein n=1 Tax=Amnibacterium flavum TaxID=2173173 RepID=A0A2V1HQY2_9MICO|nr:MFS transporter [Amnibacterium flavum]PVZ93529.1 hypothetical protein DDQ50_14515 [Amnibacterium flavum]
MSTPLITPEPASDAATEPARASLKERIGLPKGLSWGILAMVVFVVGDAIEVSWISSFFSTDIGVPLSQAAWIITAAGLIGAICAYAVGPLVSVFRPKRVMIMGVVGWVAADLAFILVLPTHQYWLILITFALRGLGTPLFAYSFVTWLNARAKAGYEARTQAWFWFAFSAGTQVVAGALAAALLPTVGPINTLWVGLAIAIVGGLIAVLLVKDPPESVVVATSDSLIRSLGAAVTVMVRQPKVGAGAIIKLINIMGVVAVFVIYVPFLTTEIGVPLGEAVLMFTIVGVAGVPANLVWGWLSDKLGWANTVQWIAAPINAIAIPLLFFVPQWIGFNLAVLGVVMAIWGIGVSAYVPLSALVPALVSKEDQPSALGTINLATSVGTLVGPALVAIILPALGFDGVVWTVVGAYVVSILIMFYVQLPGRARTTASIPSVEGRDE